MNDSLLTREQERFWRLHFSTSPPLGTKASIAGSPEIADQLLALYLNGKKTAGSSLVAAYEFAGEEFPRPGDYWMVLDSKQQPQALLKTLRIESHLFKDITPEIARAEGEGDLSLAYWRQAHREFFTPYLAELGIKDLENAEVLTEFYELVPKRRN